MSSLNRLENEQTTRAEIDEICRNLKRCIKINDLLKQTCVDLDNQLINSEAQNKLSDLIRDFRL